MATRICGSRVRSLNVFSFAAEDQPADCRNAADGRSLGISILCFSISELEPFWNPQITTK